MAGLHEAGVLLLDHGKVEIWNHSQAVAVEAVLIADSYGLDPFCCEVAAFCHDIGGILSPDLMLEQAPQHGFALDPSETMFPFLLHQRYSVILCREELGITDERILSAVGCHTTLKAGASPEDMALFLADKLAWDRPGEPPYEDAVREALAKDSLETACRTYIDYAMENSMIMKPHQWLLEAQAWLHEKE